MLVCPNGHNFSAKDAKFCPECGERLVERTEPISTVLYIHGDKDSNYTLAEELGLDPHATRNFAYVGLEVSLDVEIDPKTGETKAIGVIDGDNKVVLLEHPVKL